MSIVGSVSQGKVFPSTNCNLEKIVSWTASCCLELASTFLFPLMFWVPGFLISPMLKVKIFVKDFIFFLA